MKKYYHLPLSEKEVHVYGSGASYYRDMEELVSQFIGMSRLVIDESAAIIGNMTYDRIPDSYKNKSEFLRHSF